MPTISIPTYLNIDLKFELASIGVRIGAYLIDWLIKIIYLIAISYALKSNEAFIINFFVVYAPVIFYSLILEVFNKGQSIGKMILKCRVMSMEGNYPSVYQCATRWIFLSVDAWILTIFLIVKPIYIGFAVFSPLIGLMIIAFNKNHQRLGDMAANTIVVNISQKEVNISDTIYAYSNIHNKYQPKYPQIMRLSDKDITKIKVLFEKSDNQQNYELINRLAEHIKKILKIDSNESNEAFLKQLLNDYNYYSIQENND